MRRTIATVSLSGTLRDKLEAIAAARFDGIELFEPDFTHFNGNARDLGRMAADLGLGIDLFQPLRDVEGVPDDMFRRTLDRAERKFDLMQAMGAPMVLVCSNTSPASLDDPALAAAQLHTLAERAAQRNLRIGFEALAWGRHVRRYAQAWDIVQRAHHPHLGLILDSFHTLSLNDDPAGIADIPGERIFFVQMADAPLLAMDVLQWARHHRNFPGQGQFDVANFLEQALRAGYEGALSLEIFNDVFRETPNRRTALDAMRSLLYLESQVRERLEAARLDTGTPSAAGSGSGADAARRALDRTELFDPPAPPPLQGLAFIEFAADDAAAVQLGALLTRMGFVLAGRHRSKAVTLYKQGGVRLIVNAQPNSEARARFDVLGPSVCAIGVATPDPMQAASHAAALLSARHDSPRGLNELRLPAIVSPGGMLVHFVPDGEAIEADFAMVPQAEAPAAEAPQAGRLEGVDHLVFGLAQGQFDTWMLFCRAVLALERGESLELADPYGLIRSVSLASADRSLRLVLNMSLSQRTHTAHLVTAAGGSGGGVHHIALRCDDIFAAVERMRAAGVGFVPISANYYDDLLARLGLEEAPVRRMQALGILYDRSAEGEFWHAYTEAFDGRFFFELVQRSGYDGYGAANASARLASQVQGR